MNVVGTDDRLNRDNLLPKTSWGLINAAVRGDLVDEARREIFRRYYRPVCAYTAAILKARNGGRLEEDPVELAHEFFVEKVFDRVLEKADPKRSFRPFLKQALRNFLIERWRVRVRDEQRLKRPDADTRGWEKIGSVEPPEADAEFHNAWVRGLLGEVLERVRALAEQRGMEAHLEIFLGRYLAETDTTPGWAELGERYELDQKQARNRSDTIAEHFQRVLREVLIEETGSIEVAEEELATLLALLRGK